MYILNVFCEYIGILFSTVGLVSCFVSSERFLRLWDRTQGSSDNKCLLSSHLDFPAIELFSLRRWRLASAKLSKKLVTGLYELSLEFCYLKTKQLLGPIRAFIISFYLRARRIVYSDSPLHFNCLGHVTWNFDLTRADTEANWLLQTRDGGKGQHQRLRSGQASSKALMDLLDLQAKLMAGGMSDNDNLKDAVNQLKE